MKVLWKQCKDEKRKNRFEKATGQIVVRYSGQKVEQKHVHYDYMASQIKSVSDFLK